MKKFLFYYSQLNIGGAEKSLIRLMNILVGRGDQVVYLGRYSHGKGEYLLDDRVKRIWLSQPLKKGTKLFQLLNLTICFCQRLIHRIWIKRSLDKFDIAFVGLQGLSPKVVIKDIKATKKCIFIRSDISKAKGRDAIIYNIRKYFNQLDYFICVAETVKEALVRMVPDAEQKAVVIYNILSAQEMLENIKCAPNPFTDEKDNIFRILTPCRISDSSKGVFRMVRICKKLVDSGFRFRWYVVGDGLDLALLKKAIVDAGIENVMMTPGRVDNPFGYYRECNLVAMLSFYEGLCGVVNEAKIVGKAIIATEVSGIHEQLEHGVNGWIVENNEEKILDGMKTLLGNPSLIHALSNTIYPKNLLNDQTKIEKIYRLC